MEYKITTRKRKIYVIGKLKIIILQDILFTDILIYLTKWNMFSYVEFYINGEWTELNEKNSSHSLHITQLWEFPLGKLHRAQYFHYPT